MQVNGYAASMVTCTGHMLDSLWAPDRGGIRNVYADFNSMTFDIAVNALFGAEVATSAQGKTLTDSIREAFGHFTRRAATGFVVPEWLPTPDNLQYNGAVHRLDRYIFSLIASRRAELHAAAVTKGSGHSLGSPPDLLTALLLSQDEDGSRMEDGPMRDELMTLLIAGQETSAILLGWMCACLAWNPEAQEAAALEVQVCYCPFHMLSHVNGIVLACIYAYSDVVRTPGARSLWHCQWQQCLEPHARTPKPIQFHVVFTLTLIKSGMHRTYSLWNEKS
jgi:cytochrome P450